jgi:hypothetical protein
MLLSRRFADPSSHRCLGHFPLPMSMLHYELSQSIMPLLLSLLRSKIKQASGVSAADLRDFVGAATGLLQQFQGGAVVHRKGIVGAEQ